MNKSETKWERVELLRLYEKNRSSERCIIVRGLQKQANTLTEGIRNQITTLQKKLSDILEENHLSNFGDDKYSCNPEKHVSLVEFDKETDLNKQQILNGTFEGKVTD